jgi:hypothetical protein
LGEEEPIPLLTLVWARGVFGWSNGSPVS